MMKKGFTLIEYLVVIAVIGILSATVVVGLSNFVPSLKLNGSAKNLQSHLRQAQEEAITTQKQHAIRFDLTSNPNKYQLIKIDAGETVVRSIDIPENVAVTLSGDISNSQIVFSPDGAPSSSGEVTFSSGGKTKVITISPAGVIKLP